MKTKTFDCIQMKDDAQRRRAEAMRGLTARQRMEYYRLAYEELVKRRAKLSGNAGESRGSHADSDAVTR